VLAALVREHERLDVARPLEVRARADRLPAQRSGDQPSPARRSSSSGFWTPIGRPTVASLAYFVYQP